MDIIGVFRRLTAQKICSTTTTSTQYLVKGSGPHSLVTYEARLAGLSGWKL